MTALHLGSLGAVLGLVGLLMLLMGSLSPEHEKACDTDHAKERPPDGVE